jgi:hypothetical protein
MPGFVDRTIIKTVHRLAWHSARLFLFTEKKIHLSKGVQIIMAKTMADAISAAGQRAIIRDQESIRRHSPDLALVSDQERKANQTRHTIVRIRDVNEAPFVQSLSENINTLRAKQILSSADELLMFKLSTLVSLRSNEIVIGDERHHTPTNGELAANLGYSERQFRNVARSLLEKGIIYQVVDAEEIKKYGQGIKERMLVMNPELFVASDKNRLEITLLRLHIMCEKLERTFKVLLPWKIWYAPGNDRGRLYRRETYLLKKKEHMLVAKNSHRGG